ncbi:MAG: alpha/beta fold hydrolase [Anaerolineae bacterium]
MSAIVIKGGLIHYEAFGRGKPLVFVHGWLGSWRYWMPAMEELSDRYRTYALDLWGFGDSDKSQDRYTVAEYVELVTSFMEEMGIGKAALVGHALGGAVAVRFAVLYPERVDRLMAVCLPLSGEAISLRTLTADSNLLFGGLFGYPREYQPVQQEMKKTAENAILHSAQSVMELDLLADLESLKVPLLIVYGQKDRIVDPNQARLLSINATVRSMYMAEAKHFPMLEESSKFNRLLRDFLELDFSKNGALGSLEFKDEWRRRVR